MKKNKCALICMVLAMVLTLSTVVSANSLDNAVTCETHVHDTESEEVITYPPVSHAGCPNLGFIRYQYTNAEGIARFMCDGCGLFY